MFELAFDSKEAEWVVGPLIPHRLTISRLGLEARLIVGNSSDFAGRAPAPAPQSPIDEFDRICHVIARGLSGERAEKPTDVGGKKWLRSRGSEAQHPARSEPKKCSKLGG